MQVADAVGREFLLKQLGLGSQDAYTVSRVESQIGDDLAELQTLQQIYGRNHPEIVELNAASTSGKNGSSTGRRPSRTPSRRCRSRNSARNSFAWLSSDCCKRKPMRIRSGTNTKSNERRRWT